MRDRRPTSTSSFGVGRPGEPRRFGASTTASARPAVGRRRRPAARSRSPSRSSAATPATWTRSPTGRSRWSSPRRRTSPASSTRRSWSARACPSSYLEYLQLLTDVFAECVRKLEPGGRIAVNVANLGPQAVPQPVGRRHPHPRGRPRAAAARRADLAEGRGRQRLVRVGVVPQRGQPGAARHHRAGRRRQQGPLRPGPVGRAQRDAEGLPHRARCSPRTSWR